MHSSMMFDVQTINTAQSLTAHIPVMQIHVSWIAGFHVKNCVSFHKCVGFQKFDFWDKRTILVKYTAPLTSDAVQDKLIS